MTVLSDALLFPFFGHLSIPDLLTPVDPPPDTCLQTDLKGFADVLDGVDCGFNGQEASLEAIRRILPPYSGFDLEKACADDSSTSTTTMDDCSLTFRPGSIKLILLATDEDSDLPIKSKYFAKGQYSSSSMYSVNRGQRYDADGGDCYPSMCNFDGNDYEPAWTPAILDYVDDAAYTYYRNSSQDFRLTDPFLREVALTADALVSNQALLLSWIPASGVGTSDTASVMPVSVYDETSSYWWSRCQQQQQQQQQEQQQQQDPTVDACCDRQSANSLLHLQYGSPRLQVQDVDFTGFSADATLQNLIQAGLAQSLQAYVLAYGGRMRVYDLDRMLLSSESELEPKPNEQPSTSGDGTTTAGGDTTGGADDPTATTIRDEILIPFAEETARQVTQLQRECTFVAPSGSIDIRKPVTGIEGAGGNGGNGGTTPGAGKPTTPGGGPNDNTNGGGNNGSLPLPVLIGIVVGALALLGLVGAGVVLARRRSTRRRAEADVFRSAPLPTTTVNPPVDNPLYERGQSTRFTENPLYTSRQPSTIQPLPSSSTSMSTSSMYSTRNAGATATALPRGSPAAYQQQMQMRQQQQPSMAPYTGPYTGPNRPSVAQPSTSSAYQPSQLSYERSVASSAQNTRTTRSASHQASYQGGGGGRSTGGRSTNLSNVSNAVSNDISNASYYSQ